MLISGYKLLYDGAEVAFIKSNNYISLDNFSEYFYNNIFLYFSFIHDKKINYIVIDLSYFCSEEMIRKYFSEINLEEIKNIRTYKFLTVLKSLTYGIGFVDLCDYKSIFTGLCETISSRNYECLKSFLMNYKTNKLICFFLLRDVIENIKVYIYFLMDGPNNYLNFDENLFDNSKFSVRIEQLRGTKKLSFDFKKILEKHSELNIYNDEFDQIEKIGKMCNNYIHKNGYKTMEMLYLRNIDENKLLDYMFYILKTYFSIVVSFDGKNISSSDYLDYLDMGVQPPENSQYWVAPIYKMFIYNEFSKDEIEKMRRNTYMYI